MWQTWLLPSQLAAPASVSWFQTGLWYLLGKKISGIRNFPVIFLFIDPVLLIIATCSVLEGYCEWYLVDIVKFIVLDPVLCCTEKTESVAEPSSRAHGAVIYLVGNRIYHRALEKVLRFRVSYYFYSVMLVQADVC